MKDELHSLPWLLLSDELATSLLYWVFYAMGGKVQSGYTHLFLLFSLVFLLSKLPQVKPGDGEALTALRASIDPLSHLGWGEGSDFCQWKGVKQCINGRATKLVVENLNLSGTIGEESLNQLDQLRVLSFKGNLLSGPIPQLHGLVNLKALFLNSNRLSGGIPLSISQLHRLKVITLFGNRLSGEIPPSLTVLSRLYVLYLQDNQLTGIIPPFNQTSLRFFNVSNNALSGSIPLTAALSKFNESSFADNTDLCGEQVHILCSFALSPSPHSFSPPEISHHNWKKKLILIVVPSIVVFCLLCICVIFVMRFLRNRSKKPEITSKTSEERDDAGEASGAENKGRGQDTGNGGEFAWDQGGDGLVNLVFLGPGDEQMNYSLEDLLKASAETLGRGTIGSSYKAVMVSGYIVTVKRLKDAGYPTMEVFRRHIEVLGRLRHPNLVPLRAYFQAKEERLLVYDYFPNGSLFSLLHGSRAVGGSKPLHWTSCLKIAEDLAAGLVCIHQVPGLAHGNLKSSNVLLGPEFESCITDYGLNPFRNPGSLEETSASSLFYRAPECRDIRKPSTQQADVYSYGVLLLELLTGKTPFQDLVQEHGSDIPKWVRAVREEESESGEDQTSGNEASEDKLNALLNIAVSCVSISPVDRPLMRDVLRMIREARAEAHLSSNSSDQSPGRWSDTVQNLPRQEQQLSI